jgi:hypothetical protein
LRDRPSLAYHPIDTGPPTAIALDASGAVILAGNPPDVAGSVARYAIDGSLEAVRTVAALAPNGGGVDAYLTQREIVVAPSGRVSVAGTLTGTVDFGGGAVAGLGWNDAFLMTTDASIGAFEARRFGDSGLQSIFGMVEDASGARVLAGQTSSSFSLGEGLGVVSTCSDMDCQDLFLARIAP